MPFGKDFIAKQVFLFGFFFEHSLSVGFPVGPVMALIASGYY